MCVECVREISGLIETLAPTVEQPDATEIAEMIEKLAGHGAPTTGISAENAAILLSRHDSEYWREFSALSLVAVAFDVALVPLTERQRGELGAFLRDFSAALNQRERARRNIPEPAPIPHRTEHLDC